MFILPFGLFCLCDKSLAGSLVRDFLFVIRRGGFSGGDVACGNGV